MLYTGAAAKLRVDELIECMIDVPRESTGSLIADCVGCKAVGIWNCRSCEVCSVGVFDRRSESLRKKETVDY